MKAEGDGTLQLLRLFDYRDRHFGRVMELIANDMCIHLVLVRRTCNICRGTSVCRQDASGKSWGSRDTKEIANPAVRRRRGTTTNLSHISP